MYNDLPRTLEASELNISAFINVIVNVYGDEAKSFKIPFTYKKFDP